MRQSRAFLSSVAGMAIIVAAPSAFSQQASDSNDEVLIEEVVVTARKQEETLQSVPVTVEVVSNRDIVARALRGLEDVAKLTPGLTFDNEFGRSSDRPVIRGQANILGSSGVAIFIDGVLINGSVADYDLNDLERIEVVKGPQSALYGRNTYSGAINYITKAPDDEVRARAQARIAEDDDYELTASLSGPLVEDKLAGGVAVRYYDFGGAWTNQFNGDKIGGEESVSFSGNLVFTPNDDLRIRARAYYAETEDGPLPNFATTADENNCLFDNGSLYGGGGRYFCGVIDPRPSAFNGIEQTGLAPGLTQDTFQTSLTIDYDINENWSLTSLSAYNEQKGTSVIDGDYQTSRFQTAVFTPGGFPLSGPPFPTTFGYVGTVVDFTFSSASKTDDFQQELRLNYTDDKLDVLIGGYYLDQSSTNRDTRTLAADAQATATANFNARRGQQLGLCFANPICSFIVPLFGSTIAVPRDVTDTGIENIAAFGRVAYRFTDRLTASVEGRYQSEKITFNAVIQDLGGTAETAASRETFNSFNPRFTLDYELTDDMMLYGIVARGNKPGGFNGTVAIEADLPTFDEETAWSFEVGSKNVIADGQGTLNLAAFYNRIDGYQLTQNARANGNTVSAIVNAGDVELYGLEAAFFFRPRAMPGLTFTANYAFTDSNFRNGLDENQGVLDDVADDGLVNCSTGDQFPDESGCQSAFGNLKGKRLPRQSRHQFYVNVDYREQLTDGWEWLVGADLSYESSRFAQVHNLAETGSAALVSARVGFSNEYYSITFWGRNLTNEKSSPFILRYADGAQDFRRSFVGIQRRERFFGATLAASF